MERKAITPEKNSAPVDKPENSGPESERFRRLCRIVVMVLLVLIVVNGARHFYLSPEYSRTFSHVPDGVEYTLAMQNLLDGHGFTIRVNGVDYPSRYQPWFSLLFVAPALLFFEGNVLCAFFGCLAAGIIALPAAFELGRRLSGPGCGLLLAAILSCFGDFARFTNVVMTEVPYTLLLIVAAILWLRLDRRQELRTGDCLAFGFVCALAGSLRSTALPAAALVVLPLLRQRPKPSRWAAALAAAGLPAAAVVVANGAYNWLVFGSPFRSGYHFWEPLPYDYMGMVFSWKNFTSNLSEYASSLNLWFAAIPALIIAIVWPLLRRYDREAARRLGSYAIFTAAITVLTTALYLPYFSCHERFFLPVRVLLLFGGAAAATLAVQRCWRRAGNLIAAAAALLIAFAPWPDPYAAQLPHDRLRSAKIGLLSRMREQLPDNAVLLTVFQQGAAEYFFTGRSSRRLIPVSRCYEYAQMVTAPQKIAAPPAGFDSYQDQKHRQYLAEHGGTFPYPLVFSENPAAVDEIIASGRPVYVSGYTLNVNPPSRIVLQRYLPLPVSEINGFPVFQLKLRDK